MKFYDPDTMDDYNTICSKYIIGERFTSKW